MSKTLIIAKRELTSLFYSPIAYVVIGLFAIGATLFFFAVFGPGAQASLREPFELVVWLMAFLLPAISMRMISEEYREGTIESLMTAPISDAEVILGKWLGAMTFYLVLILFPFLSMTIVLEAHGSPDYGPIFTGIVGLLFVGGLYMAIGTFASTTTENQIIAFLLTVFIILVMTMLLGYLPRLTWISTSLRDALLFMNINRQFSDFAKGLIDLTNVIYFVSTTSMFLFMAVMVLQSRRWR